MWRKGNLCWRLLKGAGLCAAILWGAAASSIVTPGIWVADEHQVYRLDVTSNVLIPTYSASDEIETLSYAHTSLGVWVLTEQSLIKLDINGAVVSSLALADIRNVIDEPESLLTSSAVPDVWLVGEKAIVRLNADTEVLAQWQQDQDIKTATLSLDDSLWIATEKEIIHLSPGLVEIGRHPLPSAIDDLEAIAIDSFRDVVWLAGERQLIKFSMASSQLATISLPEALDDIEAMVLDPIDGRLWLAAEQGLWRYTDTESFMLVQDKDALGLEELEGLTWDVNSAGLWVYGERGLVHLGSVGEILGFVSHGREIESVATASLAVSPYIEISQPPLGLFTNNPRPQIDLNISGQCNVTPCILPDSYYDDWLFTLDINGVPVAGPIVDNGQVASYLPPLALPEGRVDITAQATDRFGRASNPASSHFIVDTIPPRFVSLSPEDNSEAASQSIIIEGEINEANVSVLLMDDSGATLGLAGARFGFTVTLKAGLNTFHLQATDAAGNQTARQLNIHYNTLQVAITYPTEGSTLLNTSTLVTGTYTGPPHSGVAVNGVPAMVDGNKFYVNGVALHTGSNTLTATLTTLHGANASSQATVNVLPAVSGGIQLKPLQDSGIAPHTATFEIDNQSGFPIDRMQLDFNGDGSIDLDTTDIQAPLSYQYTATGLYEAKGIFTANSIEIESRAAIVVLDGQQLDVRMTAIWQGMNAALVAGDVEGALLYLTENAQYKYRPVFEALMPHFTEIVTSYSPLLRTGFSQDIAEYAIHRPFNGQHRLYLIYFLKAGDGLWRIDAM
ncbi:MAG: hypothetical protein BMS9Abin36_0279 [Gammaproteobacteria bacterium]|nr:MAG: hypothetical protein BMS9Abin36_0279 [Gammaproteobacteria bacterium]